MEHETQDNVVEMVRAIRNRHFEDTKHMTREEKREHDLQRYEKPNCRFGAFSKSLPRLPPQDFRSPS